MSGSALVLEERKNFVVTGGIEGIGYAVLKSLLSAGHSVAVGVRTIDDRVEQRTADLSEFDGRFQFYQCDVTRPSEVSDFYRHVNSDLSRLDGMVANAGILGDARIGMISEKMLDETIDVNLKGTVRHLQFAAKLMKRTGGGSIVLVSSIIGLTGNVGQVVYAASKAGVIGVMRSAARELAADNIRVNAVTPGLIDTRMISHLPEKILQERIANIAMKRPGHPDEVAEVIRFLLEQQSSYVTGQVLGVDGGMVI